MDFVSVGVVCVIVLQQIQICMYKRKQLLENFVRIRVLSKNELKNEFLRRDISNNHDLWVTDA